MICRLREKKSRQSGTQQTHMWQTLRRDGEAVRVKKRNQGALQDLICCSRSLLRFWLAPALVYFSPGEGVMSSTQHSVADLFFFFPFFCPTAFVLVCRGTHRALKIPLSPPTQPQPTPILRSHFRGP